MAISTDQKLDYLWKKLGYGRSKTDVSSIKDATNESIPSPLLVRGDNIWIQSGLIPNTIPGSTSSIITLYPTSSPVECVVDATSSTNRTWKTNITDWIPPELGSTYLVKVYVHTSGNAATAASAGTQLFGAGSGNNDEWFFDYQSGVLNFIGTNLPNGVNFTGKSVYISGAVYTGSKGLAGTLGLQVAFNDINIGTATTTLNFKGTGISSVTFNSGISTVIVDLQSNLDGGTPTSNYGGIETIDGGGI